MRMPAYACVTHREYDVYGTGGARFSRNHGEAVGYRRSDEENEVGRPRARHVREISALKGD